MEPGRNAAIYVRVSTQEQAKDGDSLDAQLAKLRTYCAMRGLVVVAEFIEPGVTTKKPLARRPQGKRLLELARARGVDAIVIWSLDRAFRNTAECLTTVSTWSKRGVALHLFNFGGQAIDTSSAVGKLFLTVVAGVAEFERNVNGERTSLAMRHKATKCEYLGGQPRYGWRVVGRDEAVPGSGHLVADELEQRVIERVRALRAAGLGARRVASKLDAEGIKSRTGATFAAVQVERMCSGGLLTDR